MWYIIWLKLANEIYRKLQFGRIAPFDIRSSICQVLPMRSSEVRSWFLSILSVTGHARERSVCVHSSAIVVGNSYFIFYTLVSIYAILFVFDYLAINNLLPWAACSHPK